MPQESVSEYFSCTQKYLAFMIVHCKVMSVVAPPSFRAPIQTYVLILHALDQYFAFWVRVAQPWVILAHTKCQNKVSSELNHEIAD